VKWGVDLHDDFVPEYRDLPKDVQDELLAHIELLEQFGPQLARTASRGYPQRFSSRKHEGVKV